MEESKGLFAYFGGTFDPPHLGHEKIAKILAEEPLVSKIWIVPTSRNPLKAQFDPTSLSAPLGSPDDRKKWVEIWLQQLNSLESGSPNTNRKFELIPNELQKSGPSYTWDTLREISREKEVPPGKIVLIVGSDQIQSFEKWKNVEELFDQIHSVWIFQRKGYLLSPKNLPQKILALGRFRWMGPEIENFNSTEIRAHLRNVELTKDIETKLKQIDSLPMPKSLKSFFCK